MKVSNFAKLLGNLHIHCSKTSDRWKKMKKDIHILKTNEEFADLTQISRDQKKDIARTRKR